MGCFMVPGTEAVVTTVVTKAVGEKAGSGFKKKLSWLNKMLWGGSALLMFEHVWHGEVVPFFPFLTAMNSAEDTAAMLAEMSTTGVAMALTVTVLWGGMVAVSSIMEKREKTAEETE